MFVLSKCGPDYSDNFSHEDFGDKFEEEDDDSEEEDLGDFDACVVTDQIGYTIDQRWQRNLPADYFFPLIDHRFVKRFSSFPDQRTYRLSGLVHSIKNFIKSIFMRANEARARTHTHTHTHIPKKQKQKTKTKLRSIKDQGGCTLSIVTHLMSD